MELIIKISIHALREEGDGLAGRFTSSTVLISIHALREEGDILHVAAERLFVISIHALREEGDKSCNDRSP